MNKDYVTITKNPDCDNTIEYAITFNEFSECVVFMHSADAMIINRILKQNEFPNDLKCVGIFTICDSLEKHEFLYSLDINSDLSCVLYKVDNLSIHKTLNEPVAGIITREEFIIDKIDLPCEVGYEILNKFREIMELEERIN